MNKAEYVGMLLAGVERCLANNPHDDLHRYTSLNISGGFEGWNDTAWAVCLSPQSVKEGIQKIHLQDLLMLAIQRNFAIFYANGEEYNNLLEQNNLIGFDVVINLSEIFRNIFMLSQINPLLSMPFKMNFLTLLRNSYDLTVSEFVEQHFKKFSWISDNWQEIF